MIAFEWDRLRVFNVPDSELGNISEFNGKA